MVASSVSRRDVVLAALRLARRAAQRAIWTLVLAGGFYVVCLFVSLQDLAYLLGVGGIPSVERADEMNERAGGLASAGWIAFVLCTMFLTRWYRMAVRAANESGATVRWTSRRGVPFLRPYQLLRALDQAVDPAAVPEPPPTPETTAHVGGYREPAAAVRAKREMGRAPLLVWWLMWLASFAILVYRWLSVVSWTDAKIIDAVVDLDNVGVAFLGCVIIARIGGRLAERTRRAFPAGEV